MTGTMIHLKKFGKYKNIHIASELEVVASSVIKFITHIDNNEAYEFYKKVIELEDPQPEMDKIIQEKVEPFIFSDYPTKHFEKQWGLLVASCRTSVYTPFILELDFDDNRLIVLEADDLDILETVTFKHIDTIVQTDKDIEDIVLDWGKRFRD